MRVLMVVTGFLLAVVRPAFANAAAMKRSLRNPR